jgi:hypothetical protein
MKTLARNIAQEEENKRLVSTAYQRIFGDQDLHAIEECISKDFIGLITIRFSKN